MVLAQEVYTRSRALPLLSASKWPLYTTLFGISTIVTSLFLFSLAIQHLKRICKSAPQSGPWYQMSNMEKATSKSASPPPPPAASACDVLKPLSHNSNYPSSGVVAARAREQMENSGKSSPVVPAATVATQPRSGSEGDAATGSGSVQRRNESVQQMREVDDSGVRTWRRLVVEYS
ncbi:hypothetical protein N7509_007252 [Penicillium cosmopolitanum]|uniref:Uncharacterized protein n=1 Tax=Penicillium cosmopolitanum TaxID=1131564 RepID=A0A9X0B874_9EURO|nr:uncharacterized protein N7509_007252 [Penicillium cosmopolitanum]KAJ5391762.1 hypothetical protein N7509_007252 [Penicillium cosmopolitanum]